MFNRVFKIQTEPLQNKPKMLLKEQKFGPQLSKLCLSRISVTTAAANKVRKRKFPSSYCSQKYRSALIYIRWSAVNVSERCVSSKKNRTRPNPAFDTGRLGL